MDDDKFAEIEIKPVQTLSKATLQPESVYNLSEAEGLGEKGLRLISPRPPLPSWLQTPQSITQAQPIAPRASDPLREKFYEMRKLSSAKPFARSDSELFYKQARFMENFSDDYDGDAKFNMYYPYYQHMGYDYLRTYFTWRARVRRGEMRQTSLSYIFLYIYELLSGIGVADPSDGLSKLMDIWDAYSGEHSAIYSYLPKWLKDYHVFYELPHSFADFVENHNLQKHYSLTLLFTGKERAEGGSGRGLEHGPGRLEMLNSISSYDITKSKYYNDGNKEILSKCFDAAFGAIEKFCATRNTCFEDLLIYSVSRRSPWQPFRHALFANRVSGGDREVHISKYERYFCKNGEWTANLPIYYSSQRDFVGYIIKKTEACLRQATGYKHRLIAEMKTGGKSFRELSRPAARRLELDKVIEKAVMDFYRDINRTFVTVDPLRLTQIRAQAQDTQERLIIADEQIDAAPTDSVKPPPPADSKEKLTISFEDGWKALQSSLTAIERQALSIIFGTESDTSIKGFADEMNIMLEVLVDGINEKAADFIGDSILELADDVYIYDEYRGNIKRIL